VREPKWIPIDLVLLIHDRQLAEHGGREGVRNINLLESALARPHHLLTYQENVTLFDLAAAMAAGVARNHPFVDGNKRTALVISMAFLELNGMDSNGTEEEIALVFEELAAGTLTEKALARWLKEHAFASRKKPKRAK
jgi:death-on-curing protein